MHFKNFSIIYLFCSVLMRPEGRNLKPLWWMGWSRRLERACWPRGYKDGRLKWKEWEPRNYLKRSGVPCRLDRASFCRPRGHKKQLASIERECQRILFVGRYERGVIKHLSRSEGCGGSHSCPPLWIVFRKKARGEPLNPFPLSCVWFSPYERGKVSRLTEFISIWN